MDKHWAKSTKKTRRIDIRYQTSVALIIFVFWFGGAKTFLIRVAATWKQIKNTMKCDVSSLSRINATHIGISLTSSGDPNSLISCFPVGIIVTLTFSNGSITSLNTLSWPWITTSWPLPMIKEKKELKSKFAIFAGETLRQHADSI